MAKVGKILQDDRDFLVEIVGWQGHPAVKKSIRPTTAPERIKRLKNEVYGLGFFADLAKNHPDLKLYVPRLYQEGAEYIITEYIDFPPLGDDLDNLRKLAGLLAGIDAVKPYGEAMITPNFDYSDIRDRFPVWTEKALAAGVMTQDQLDKANTIIDSLERYIEPRIAHGDLSPYAHAFTRPDGRIVLVDLEVFTPRGARYYDVARCYTRLYAQAESPDVPKRFLRSFLELSEPTAHREEQLLAILVQRTVGMQRDAAIDVGKGRNYKQRAAGLLNLALQARLELFYK